MTDNSHFLEIAAEILEKGVSPGKAKARIGKKYGLKRMPGNAEILENLPQDKRKLLLPILRRKPVRTISGVAVVAVMTSPEPCPHGRCIYCPRGDDAPQSYTGYEPAALRGRRSDFDPYVQVSERLSQLNAIGHNTDKVELIVMGGTFPSRDKGYQKWFIHRCFEAMNDHGSNAWVASESLEDAQFLNERARSRNVGVTFETRPDYAGIPDVDFLLSLGATRIEMGVQTLDEGILKKVKRGHGIKEVKDATQIVKDTGLKMSYHLMPGLFSTPEEDLYMVREVFNNPAYRPDMIKIYPTLVMKGTGLYDLWKKGEFTPLEDEECIDLLARIKKELPPWVRTMRIQRDIPARLVTAGVRAGNLGELVEKRLESEGVRCRCIRCREAGHLMYKKGLVPGKPEFTVERYNASGGEEVFLSLEEPEQDILFGYLRLRYPSQRAHRPEIDGHTAIVRELKVLGHSLRIGDHEKGSLQHSGNGQRLLGKAEVLARREGFHNILVLSAVGTREYYRTQGYTRIGPYMGKKL